MTSVNIAQPIADKDNIDQYYKHKVDELEILLQQRGSNLRRLEAQRNDLNARVRR